MKLTSFKPHKFQPKIRPRGEKIIEDSKITERSEDRVLFRIENITLRVRDKFILPNTSWQIVKGQHWAVLGPNGAGKSSLVRALIGDVPVVQGRLLPSDKTGGKVRAEYISFEQHQRLIAREERLDESRFFSGKMNRITTVERLLREAVHPLVAGSEDIATVVARLKLNHLLGRSIRALSTGEMRKLQIARVLLRAPEVLILDEPFDGLDQTSRQELTQMIAGLMDDHRTVILVTHRQREISSHITHVIAIRDGQVVFQGTRLDFSKSGQLKNLYARDDTPRLSLPTSGDRPRLSSEGGADILIDMKNVTVQFGDTVALDNVNWTLKAGQNWVILGPNGSGKTTLLNLVSGDNLQGYANDIHLFGKQRGSGESIWDIKERIGMISSEFQIRYRKNMSVLDVVLSGYFDSVGLYRSASSSQRQAAEQWLADLGIDDMSDRIFNRLSYGEQRMVLIARAMVKIPQILMLDEPYQGLDRANRRRILAAIDIIGHLPCTNLIYVTHYPDEIPACSTHMLQFDALPDGRYLARQRTL